MAERRGATALVASLRCCSAGDLRCLRLALASRLAALYLVFVGGWGVMFVSVVPVRARPCPSVRPPPLFPELIFHVNGRILAVNTSGFNQMEAFWVRPDGTASRGSAPKADTTHNALSLRYRVTRVSPTSGIRCFRRRRETRDVVGGAHEGLQLLQRD